ncbi:hypothetical protein KMBAHK_KMBAHK_11665, partial [Dysosmobacter welbionis]
GRAPPERRPEVLHPTDGVPGPEDGDHPRPIQQHHPQDVFPGREGGNQHLHRAGLLGEKALQQPGRRFCKAAGDGP